MKRIVVSAFLVLPLLGGLVGCASEDSVNPYGDVGAAIEDGPEVDETGEELATPMWFATSDTAVCPSGSTFDDRVGFCVASGRALGPFTSAMVAACKAQGLSSCDASAWPLDQAAKLRGTETCPAGSKIDPALGVCTEGAFAYGPFDAEMVQECKSLGGGASCETSRIELKYVAPTVDEASLAIGTESLDTLAGNCSAFNKKLNAYYTSRAGYNQVSRAGMKTLGTRRNGCATWLSHAIRQSGVNMPVEINTERFRDALKSRGWQVIRNKADLQPGDVIITKDRKGWAGHPDHVYMFAGWSGSQPLAVDNQGFTHARGSGKSPINYGLRAPGGSGCNNNNQTNDDMRDSCGGKADGWYCSEQRDTSSYECKGGQINSGWHCSDGTVCRKNGAGNATLSGSKPGCFGSK